jgi:hypothetical protein
MLFYFHAERAEAFGKTKAKSYSHCLFLVVEFLPAWYFNLHAIKEIERK